MGISDISLASGMRASLLSLTGINAKIDRTQERLATGKKVNSALDNPTNYFAAAAHQQRAQDLNSHKDGIKEAIQVIKTADIGMNAMTSIFRQAAAIADSAKGAASLNELSQLADQFNEMRKQVDLLAADSDYRGTNLLLRQDLNINLGNNNTLTIQGADVTSSGFDNMTNGLNVETASMDPLNIVDPNYVTTTGGSIKQDGQLTIINNDVPEIDDWLGTVGIKNQTITSQDVTFTTNTSLSDGSIVQSQLLDNIGVAEYGTGGFNVYRDTTVSAAVTAGSGSVVNSSVLQVADVSKFIGPLLSDGTQPFTLERSLTQSTDIVSGAASVASTTVNNSADVLALLGPLAGSGVNAIELYRDMTASASIAGDPSAVATTVVQNGSGVADLLGTLSGSGSQTFQLYRDIDTNAAVIDDPTAVSETNILDNSALVEFLGALSGSDSQTFQLYRDIEINAAVTGDPAAISTTSILDNPALAEFLGTIEGAGANSFSLSRNVSLSSAVASVTGSVTLDMDSSADIATFIGSRAGSADKPFTLTYTSTPPTWSSSDVNSVTGIGGPPPTAVAIDLVGNGTSITANLGGSWSDGDSITITTTAGPWQSDSPAVAVTASETDLNLDLNGNGSSDIIVSLATLQKADAVIGIDVTASIWKSDNPAVTVAASGTNLNLDINGNGSSDIGISLATLQRADAVIGMNTTVSSWLSSNPAVAIAASGTDLNLDLNGNGASDIKVSLVTLQKADAVIGVDLGATDWITNNSSVTITSSGTTLGLDFSNNGTTDVTVELGALSKADVKLSTTSFLSGWFSTAHPEISVTPATTTLNINLGFDGTADLNLKLASLLYGDAKLTVTPESSIWKTSDPSISLNQPVESGAMTADLNGDGINDIQIDMPTGGPNGAAWLSTEMVQTTTTGPFRTTDSSVVLKYDDDMKTVGLILDGGGGGIDITINLEDSWAVNNLPTSPLGNGDSINLTVDGRHRWVKGDGVTPNASGISLSTSEINDAINTMRLYSAQNSSSLRILTVRDDFIGNLVNVLETGADNLTLADMNEEGAQMLMLQTRQNLGFTSLSLGSQAAQSVMRLF